MPIFDPPPFPHKTRVTRPRQVGSIAIDEGGMMGPSYSEALSSEIDGAVKSISDEPLGPMRPVPENRGTNGPTGGFFGRGLYDSISGSVAKGFFNLG